MGLNYIRFWTLLGNTLQYNEGQFGKSEAQTLLCIGYFPPSDTTKSIMSTDDNNLCFTGAINGDLYVWKKNKLDKIISGIHKVSFTGKNGNELKDNSFRFRRTARQKSFEGSRAIDCFWMQHFFIYGSHNEKNGLMVCPSIPLRYCVRSS